MRITWRTKPTKDEKARDKARRDKDLPGAIGADGLVQRSGECIGCVVKGGKTYVVVLGSDAKVHELLASSI